jgi:hypothetical protein
MSIFSLNWFKSKKKEEKVSEQVAEQQQAVIRVYKHIKMVNDVLTVILNDGSIITKTGATSDDFVKVRNSKSELEIVTLCETDEIVKEIKRVEHLQKKATLLKSGVETLKKLNDFVVEGNTVYLKGINRSLPQLLVEEFVTVVEEQKYYTGFGDLEDYLAENEEYQSLKRFFMWCCLNPRVEVADKLYEFLKKNSFRITKQGFFVALRNVVTISGDTELVQFVSNSYNKVKAVWKKKPDDFRVVETEDGYALEKTTVSPEGTIIGNLTTLYLDLPNMAENRFTDDWTKTFDIRIGRVVNMPMEKCNWSTQDCAAAGLHFTADQIHYVGCGDQSVLMLINPMKVVGIGEHKGRCYEYLPIMTVPREEATEILHDLDFDTLELDEDYAIRELENLTEKVKDGFVAESKKYEFNIPNISTVEIKNIVESLDEMKNEINKRVVSVD